MRPQGKITEVLASFQKCCKGIMVQIRPADDEVLYKWAKVFDTSCRHFVLRRKMVLNQLRGYAIDDRSNPVLLLTSEFSYCSYSSRTHQSWTRCATSMKFTYPLFFLSWTAISKISLSNSGGNLGEIAIKKLGQVWYLEVVWTVLT